MGVGSAECRLQAKVKVLDALKIHFCLSLAAWDNSGNRQSTGRDSAIEFTVLEECFHVPFCSSSFISWSFMHINVLVTKEEREGEKCWGEIKSDTSINHSGCVSK